MTHEILSGNPNLSGWYYAWELSTGYSMPAWFDNMTCTWTFPDDLPKEFEEHYVDFWTYI